MLGPRSLTPIALAVALCFGCGGGGSKSTTPQTNKPPATATSFSVSPSAATVALGEETSFTVKVASGTPPAVTWSVNGVAGGNASVGTITANGAYTAPSSFPSDNTVTVTATAKSNASQKANASVTIVYPNKNGQSQSAPVKMGTSGGNNTDMTSTMCCSGTLGALLRRDGNLYVLSNNHVLAKSDLGDKGDPIGQPGLADHNCTAAKVVAHLSQFPPLQSSNVDAAMGQIVSGEVDTSGSILMLGAAGDTSIAAAPPSSTLADPAAVLSSNTRVAKSGRSTGLTCSTVESVNTTVSVDYDKSCGGVKAFTATFQDQVVIAGGAFSAGGDSGSLVVTADNARPVGLLYAGNDNSTIANPIDDVLRALQNPDTHAQPSVVGGGDHPVSCAPTAKSESAVSSTGASAVELPALELDRARSVKERFEGALMADPAIQGIGVGRSLDDPGRAAITLYLSGTPMQAVPQEIDGVRTQVVTGTPFAPRSGAAPRADDARSLDLRELRRGLLVKEQRAAELLAQSGVLAVGVGRSQDAPGESALVIYVERGTAHPALAATLDGVRTRIVEGQRFKALGWNERAQPRACKPPTASAR